MNEKSQLTRKVATLVAALALGAGAAGFVTACGDDDDDAADKASTAAKDASSTASSVSSTVQDAADEAKDDVSTAQDATGN